MDILLFDEATGEELWMAVKWHMTKANMADVVPITFLLHTYRICRTYFFNRHKESSSSNVLSMLF